ncbi:MAG: aminotransferase class V-fold PLP-dependent enzyme [Spirochaetia bacterium]
MTKYMDKGAHAPSDGPEEDLWDRVRRGIIGGNAFIDTPFGRRRLTYADHTASGRAITFIEDHIRACLELYGNTHSEDDATGIATTERLREAEASIKRLVNAGPEHKIIAVGAGTTAAVHHLQQILGIFIPPAGRDFFKRFLKDHFSAPEYDALVAGLLAVRPVVFVGPYEHHSNEVSWRECFAEVVEIELSPSGLLDLDDLQDKVTRKEYAGRKRIGAFSAASNVSGVTTPVYEVARILHKSGSLAFFDFAAAAPYVAIDMRHDLDSFFDAIYFSPHKLLGGPGSSGILIFHQGIYRADLPPTVGAGGTVDFVDFKDQAYSADIETREKPGTPGIEQTLRAALAMELKESMGPARIQAREEELVRRVYARLSTHTGLVLMGDVSPEHRLPIFSFNVRAGTAWLHPRFVTTLLNDLFGIQSRAGCSCAAPYGHRILHIDGRTSRELRRSIACGNMGLKPGWVRVNFHFLHTEEEIDFICCAILFVADQGKYFLPQYRFNMSSGAWNHTDFVPARVPFGIDDALRAEESRGTFPAGQESDAARLFDEYLREAERRAVLARERWSESDLRKTEEDLIPFAYVTKA